LFESTDTPPPDRPPFWLPAYLGLGLAIGGAAFGLAMRPPARAKRRAGFVFFAAAWPLVAGIAGLIVAGLWGFTDHTAAYRNENVLQASALALPLLWLVPRTFRNPRAGRWAFVVALVVAGLSAVGLLLQLLPAFDQVNGEIIALALPAHLGVAAGLARLTRLPVKTRKQ
jgi:hypothetical protein